MFSLLRFSFVVLLLVSVSSLIEVKAQTSQLTDKQLHDLRLEAVKRINTDRTRQNLPPVQFDELSSKVGDAHCREIVERGVISHWSSDGRKPYMRYSWAGGRDGVAENLAYTHGSIQTDGLAALTQELNILQDGFINEKPPYDGHKRNIFTKYHTNVGIGIAWTNDGLCYAQEFIDRYVTVDQIPTVATLTDNLLIKGSVISSSYRLHSIEIVYEPLPRKMSNAELANTYAYDLPQDDHLVLRPKAPEGEFYADGTDGEITQKANTFEAQMNFFKKAPGIYTIVVWVVNLDEQIQATTISIKVEK